MQISQQLKNLDRPRKSQMTRIEKIIAHYVHDLSLSDGDEEYRQLLEAANKYNLAGRTKMEIAKLLEKKHSIKKSKAYQVINESEELFGEIGKSNKEGLRHIQTEWYKKLARKLEKEKNYELAILCRQRIDKINGLEEKKGNTININKVLMPRQLIFTTDPAALDIQRQMEEAEDADYEEMETE